MQLTVEQWAANYEAQLGGSSVVIFGGGNDAEADISSCPSDGIPGYIRATRHFRLIVTINLGFGKASHWCLSG